MCGTVALRLFSLGGFEREAKTKGGNSRVCGGGGKGKRSTSPGPGDVTISKQGKKRVEISLLMCSEKLIKPDE